MNACGERFKLKSVNWYGASGLRDVVGGLQYQSLDSIVTLLAQQGFNSVRLPFSNAMLHNPNPVNSDYLSANPDLVGKTPLQVLDAVVKALNAHNIAVILNNHTTTSEWCCGFDFNGLWYHSGGGVDQTTAQWQQDWLDILARYQAYPAVVGADLRNEVRTMRWNNSVIPVSPNWGSGDANDWRLVAQQTGNLIHSRFDELLIIVEGINWWGSLPILGSGERPHLQPVNQNPINLVRANKLVYAAHNYGFIGPNHNGSDDTSAGNIKYSDMDENTLRQTLDREWGFVLNDDMPYTAPIWVSEFGASYAEGDDRHKAWFTHLVNYLLSHDLDFAYWPLNPQKGDGALDTFALLQNDWSGFRTDWRTADMQRLLAFTGQEGEVSGEENAFSLLNFKNNDHNVSSLVADWDSGAQKATCRDGDRLIGISDQYNALCSSDHYGYLWSSAQNRYTVNSEASSPRGYDWAGGFTKYECGTPAYVSGVSKRWWGTSGVLCSESNRPLGQHCQTLWFNRGDNRLSQRAGDWAAGEYKGQCADHQYLAGVAQRNGNAAALLCCE